MRPPATRAGRVGLSLGALGAGAAVGGVAGRFYLSGQTQQKQDAGTATGALLGVTAAGLGGLVLDKYTADKWGAVGGTTAALGLSGVALLGGAVLLQKLQALKGATPAVPQLPLKTYTATTQDSGRSLTMAVGDQLLVTLPQTPTSGQTWQWSSSAPLKWMSQTEPETSQSFMFSAASAGTGVLTASLTDVAGVVSATFTLNIQVVS